MRGGCYNTQGKAGDSHLGDGNGAASKQVGRDHLLERTSRDTGGKDKEGKGEGGEY